jgi:CSLREA domain-containing protein
VNVKGFVSLRQVFVVLLAVVLLVGPFLLSARPARAAVTFVVTTTGDQRDHDLADDRCDVSRTRDGDQCTLRAAIQEANDTFGADTIAFDIPGPLNQPKIIKPNDPATPGGARGALPSIVERVTIDGYTQPGARANTEAVGTNSQIRIEIDGTHTAAANGLDVNPTASNTLIRGLAIGGFDNDGIEIDADGVRVVGCFVGTDAAGTQARPNGNDGVEVNATDVIIGGGPLAARNLISGNGSWGVALFSAPGARAQVLGNLIGTGRTGVDKLGNVLGGVYSGQTGAQIGGGRAAEANVIRFNGGDGVAVGAGTRNRVLRNVIGGNARQGIDLNNDGRTANDPGDADAGANNMQNFPEIIGATSNSVQVSLNSLPDQNFSTRLYSNPGGGDEGIQFHGTFTVGTDVIGNTGPVDLTPKPPIPAGRSVTATATRSNGDTSEFSDSMPVT